MADSAPFRLDSLPAPILPRPGFHGLPRISLAEFCETDPNVIHIGLVNNMPDSALEATERQFRAVLGAAAHGMMVRLSLFALPDVPRSEEGRCYIGRRYSGISDLWNNRLDGIIVTGAEPGPPSLMDEPYWGNLARLANWAEDHTHSSIWSCLAAHAAVLQIDGIKRQRLRQKLSGLFACERAAGHPLTADVPEFLTGKGCRVPHSRWNDVPERALRECGYQVLTRSERAGADMFVKRRKSLFVFFQGHPEYDAESLPLEYRRDIRRFLRGERNAYPAMPSGCFDEETSAQLVVMQNRAIAERREELLSEFPRALAAPKLPNAWRPAAVSIYRNWLLNVGALKEQRLKSRLR